MERDRAGVGGTKISGVGGHAGGADVGGVAAWICTAGGEGVRE
jgi:hypothetical protein